VERNRYITMGSNPSRLKIWWKARSASCLCTHTHLHYVKLVDFRVNLTKPAPEPPAVGFGKPVSKSWLPLKTEQIQKPNQKASAICLKRFTDR
jgi:hypothetical protein